MKTLFVAIIFLMTSCTLALADVYTLEFSYPQENEANIDGFSLFERVNDERVTVIEEIIPSVRTADFETDPPVGECKTYFMAKYTLADNGIQKLYGAYSPTFGLCPEQPLPPPIEYTVDDDTVIEITIKKKAQ